MADSYSAAHRPLIVIPARAEHVTPESALRWGSLDVFASDRSHVDYQQWAVRVALSRRRAADSEDGVDSGGSACTADSGGSACTANSLPS